MDLFCLFYTKEIEYALTQEIIALSVMADRAPYRVYEYLLWNLESQQELWRSLLCG